MYWRPDWGAPLRTSTFRAAQVEVHIVAPVANTVESAVRIAVAELLAAAPGLA